jgi:hypothetical protein
MVIRKIMAYAATTVALIVGGVLIMQAPAQAAYRDGWSPYSGGCASSAWTARDAWRGYDYGGSSVYIELRYSSGCRTVWAKVTASRSEHFWVERSGGGYQDNWGKSGYTNMLNDANRVSRACSTMHSAFGGSYVATVCTGWY